MKKYPILFLLITILFLSCKKEEENTPEELNDKIYAGSLVNPDNVELQNFFEKGYNIVKGDIVFENQDLINLAALEHVKKLKVA